MSVFKTTGIVLKVKKQSEKESLYTVLFQDYGILLVQKKKKIREKSLDTGYSIGCEIVTKSQRDIHTIGNIKVTSQFIYENRSFQEIELYLKIVGYILREMPKGVPHHEIYSILEYINKHNSQIPYQKLVLIFLKIQCIMGNLGEKYPDATVQKIILFLRNHSIGDTMRLSKIQDDIFKKLEQLL